MIADGKVKLVPGIDSPGKENAFNCPPNAYGKITKTVHTKTIKKAVNLPQFFTK